MKQVTVTVSPLQFARMQEMLLRYAVNGIDPDIAARAVLQDVGVVYTEMPKEPIEHKIVVSWVLKP